MANNATRSARQAQINNEESDEELEAQAQTKERQAVVDAAIPAGGCRFVFVGDPRDARRGPLFEVDEETGEDSEPPLRLMGLKFPRLKAAILVTDEYKIRKLRGNDHFIELKPGEDLNKALKNLPRAVRERRDNINVAKLGVPSENPQEDARRRKLSRRDRDLAEEFEGDGEARL